MKSKYCYPLVGVLSIAATAWAQDAQNAGEVTPVSPAVVTPVSVTSGAKLPAKDAKVTPIPDGPYDMEATVLKAELDDRIPLPVQRVLEPGPNGDVEVSPASGDPFFLSFIAGPYTPPENELVDPALLLLDGSFGDARPGNDTYAMVMFQKRITDERIETLKALDCRILGFHPHYTIRVAVPVDRLLDVSTLDFVRWVGAPRTWQKIHPMMRSETKGLAQTAPLDLYVSVFESDMNENSVREYFGSIWGVTPENEEGFPYEETEERASRYHSNGWMHHQLESMGLEVREYRRDIDTFVVTGTLASVAELSELDFVQFIEPIPTDEMHMTAVHDESIPMVMGDETRALYDGSLNSIAQVGIIDSGVENSHSDIDIAGWGWNCTSQTSAWNDTVNGGFGHGTHVTGTILGNGDSQADHTGMAPGLATFGSDKGLFNYRRFPNPCSDSLSTMLDRMNDPVGAGSVPHVVNNSWGSSYDSGPYLPTGTEADARTIDTHIFNTGQVCVWSSGNYSYQTVGIQGSAKNALTVGNSMDNYEAVDMTPGDIWTSSGRGPLADNRWKPNVNAPGHMVSSATANNNTGYVAYSGTSMAAPHVTGLIAQLIDHHSFLRDREPAEFAALLMATAQTNDNTIISFPASTHLDTFGAGRINATRAHGNGSDWQWRSWSPTLIAGNWTFGDFTVPVGATKLVVVMNYNEVAAGAGAGSALVNDLDLYLDRDPIDPAGNTGEYSFQQSSVDNTEIRIVPNPASGPWRWKVWPDSVTSNVNLGVTVLWTTGDLTPDNTVTVTASDSFIQPHEHIDVDVNVAAGDYVSAATYIDFDGTSRTIHSKSLELQDGIVSDLSDSGNTEDYITLGDIRQGRSKNASYRISYAFEGTKSINIQTRSENANQVIPSIQVVVDGTQPGAVSGLHSPSHTVGQWSNDPTIQWNWTAATDDRSGVAGYGIFAFTFAGLPGQTQDIGPVTTFISGAYPSSNSSRYFSIRTVDNSGNWDGNFVSDGPYFIETVDPTDATYSSSNIPQGGDTCSGSVTVNWSAATDAHSGVAGYGLFWSQSPTAIPSQILDTTGTSDTLSGVLGTWYLHIKTVDTAGNWTSNATHLGPFTLTAECGTEYCNPGLPNSTGASSVLTVTGSDIVSDNDLTLNASNMPTGNFGYFLAATNQGPPITPPGSQGQYCLGGQLGRFNAGNQIRFTGATGAFSLDVDLTSIPVNPAQAVAAGQSWSFQAWHRDQNPFNTSNFTNVVTVLFK